MFDDLGEGLHRFAQLVRLCGDECQVAVAGVRVARLGDARLGRVGEAAGLAHLLEYDRVHAAPEVLVVEPHTGVVRRVVVLAAARHLEVAQLVGVEMRDVDFVFGCEELLHVGSVRRLGPRGCGVVGRELRPQLLLARRSEVKDAVGPREERAHRAQQLFGGELQQPLVGERRGPHEVGAVKHQALQCGVVAALAHLGVRARLEEVLFQCGEDRLVGLGPCDQVLHDFHRAAHVLAQTRDGDVGAFAHGAE